jgi:hypothetical protein
VTAKQAIAAYEAALGDVRSVMGAYQEGATTYITKPIVPESLFETLRNLGVSI